MDSPSYELARFDLANMVECGATLRASGKTSHSMEEVADGIVRHLHQSLVDADGTPACALVRFYKTHAYGGLPVDLQRFASGIMGAQPAWPEMKCLTLLASTGDEIAWQSRGGSSGHKAIPLPSEDFVSQLPMIRQLVGQLGLEMKDVLTPDPEFLLDVEQKTFNVFHVPVAEESPFVPGQEFVAKYGIKSVLGFGGMLVSGDLFATILFSKVAVEREIAELFAPLALGVTMAIQPFVGRELAALDTAAE